MTGIADFKRKFRLFSGSAAVRRILVVIGLIGLWHIGLPAPNACAGVPVPAANPCDPNYYNSLRSRAWMEAQREITQNQNLIFKPDSVLEYTCFDRFLNELALDSQNMFSETTRWGPVPGIRAMETDLDALVGVALRNYISGNFSHTFLGGRSGLDYTPGVIVDGSYSCDMMSRIWQEAKCMDFISNAGHDAFFTFAQFAAGPEHRFLPTACTQGIYGAGNRWVTESNLALVDANTPWIEDNTLPFFNLLNPANCAANPPVETGIRVVRAQQAPTTYDEKVCLSPGCYYVPTGVTTGNCTRP